MPMYTYKDKNTDVKVDVIRTFDEMEQVPTLEECGEKLNEEQHSKAVWERVIGGGISVLKGPTWGWGKGHW
jgi:predicted nucleic acid-binding Zn ribbon protein